MKEKNYKNYILIEKPVERAFLIGLNNKESSKEEYQESMEELKRLAATAETEVAGMFIQALDKPNPSTWIGKGKLEEIKQSVKKEQVTTLIFNDNLSPVQSRNITKTTHCNIVDRTELILDIFAKHAKTKESMIQVELAQLEYSYSKLRNLWQHFSRIEGGIGVRGPGEKQIEIDRREIKKRILMLKKRLFEIRKVTETKRKGREDSISICLVGYTNAGKSTLFNRLTRSSVYTADQLFATLDATTRSIKYKGEEKVLITDTIGFIDHLPHTLVQSFYSTLFEVREADLLLHVIDISHPKLHDQISSVNLVLEDLQAKDKNILFVFNKYDLCNTLQAKFLKKQLKEQYQDCVFISAKEKMNIEELFNKIDFYLQKRKLNRIFGVPTDMNNLINFLHKKTHIVNIDFNEKQNEYIFDVLIDYKYLKTVQDQIKHYKLNKYINS